MKKIKFIKRQDSGFKLSYGNSGETSLNLSNEIFDFISKGALSPGEERNVTFRIFKEDCIKAMSFVIMKLPLYKSSSNYSNKVDNYLEIFGELYSKIESFFGSNKEAEYKVSLLYRPDGRIYLKGLRVNGFSIRDYLVENYSALQFDNEGNDILNLRVLSDIEDNGEYDDESQELEDVVSKPLQQIFYGAPGTGKSHEVKKRTGELSNDEERDLPNVFRTTFHPDTDYASFVGCYKPSMRKTGKKHQVDGKDVDDEQNQDDGVQQVVELVRAVAPTHCLRHLAVEVSLCHAIPLSGRLPRPAEHLYVVLLLPTWRADKTPYVNSLEEPYWTGEPHRDKTKGTSPCLIPLSHVRPAEKEQLLRGMAGQRVVDHHVRAEHPLADYAVVLKGVALHDSDVFPVLRREALSNEVPLALHVPGVKDSEALDHTLLVAVHTRDQDIVVGTREEAAHNRNAALFQARDEGGPVANAHLRAAKLVCLDGKPRRTTRVVEPVGKEAHGPAGGTARVLLAAIPVEHDRVHVLEHLRRKLLSLEQVAQGVCHRGRAAVIPRHLVTQGYLHVCPQMG